MIRVHVSVLVSPFRQVRFLLKFQPCNIMTKIIILLLNVAFRTRKSTAQWNTKNLNKPRIKWNKRKSNNMKALYNVGICSFFEIWENLKLKFVKWDRADIMKVERACVPKVESWGPECPQYHGDEITWHGISRSWWSCCQTGGYRRVEGWGFGDISDSPFLNQLVLMDWLFRNSDNNRRKQLLLRG